MLRFRKFTLGLTAILLLAYFNNIAPPIPTVKNTQNLSPSRKVPNTQNSQPPLRVPNTQRSPPPSTVLNTQISQQPPAVLNTQESTPPTVLNAQRSQLPPIVLNEQRSFLSSEGAEDLRTYLHGFFAWRTGSDRFRVKILGANGKPLKDEKLLRDFQDLILPGASSSRWKLAHEDEESNRPHHIVLDFDDGSGGERLQRMRSAWAGLPAGTLWIVRVSDVSIAGFENRAFPLMYKVNCISMEVFMRGGRGAFTCADQPYNELYGVTFVRGFILVEKGDQMMNKALVKGELLSEVFSRKPRSDKFETQRHDYQSLYSRYLPRFKEMANKSTDEYRPTMLEIGLGCNMIYGPGASARLWRRFFGSGMRLHYVEYDKKCVRKWKAELDQLELLVHVGPQEADATNTAVLQAAPREGFQVVIDDGGHMNHQIVKSLDTLWPHMAKGGIYFAEDMGDPAFISWAYSDAEVVQSLDTTQQKRTALAHILRNYAADLVKRGSDTVEFIDCRKNICAIKKKG